MIGPFRIERLIAAGSMGAVYEATQLSLGRTVALRVIGPEHFASSEQIERFEDQQRRLASIRHPNLVPFYESGEWRGGRFVATRFIRGAKLSDLQEDRLALPVGALETVADALRVAHAAGVVHGRVSGENILIEANGTAYLTDLGLGRAGTPEADRQALAAVISEFERRAASRRNRRPARRAALAVAAAVGAVISALVLTLGGDEEAIRLATAAPGPENTRSVGSSLPPVATTPLGCIENPTPNTPSCTFVLTRLDGSTVAIPRAGVVRGWAVRGASGEVSLQIVRERDGRSFIVGFSQPEQVSGAGPHAFTADISVGAGDSIGVGLGPGATIGSRADRLATLARFDGRLTADPRPESEVIRGVEVMIRADIELDAMTGGPRQLTGALAAAAPPGTPLTESPIVAGVGRGFRVSLVRLPSGIAIDVTGDRRVARLAVPDADPDGEFRELSHTCGPVGPGGFCLRWQNPETDQPLKHEYRVRQDGTLVLLG